MRSRMQRSVSASEVHATAAGWLQETLPIEDHGPKCRASVLISVVLYAAARVTSISDACKQLLFAPTGRAVAQALVSMMPQMQRLEQQINNALLYDIPKSLRRRSRPMAVDLTEIPYHGQPFQDPREVRRGQPKSGTSHFHAYATLYVVRRGERFTIAVTYVFQGDTMEDVLKRLLRKARAAGIKKPRYLLLDRGFYSVDVIRYCQHARQPFLMPVTHRGRPAKDPETARGTRTFARWKTSGWSQHTMTNKNGRKATFSICVSCGNYAGRWKRRGRRTFVFACWGLPPRTTRWVREEYRKRFGIETSYRQMNQARIRTCTRNPLSRMLYVGVALVLRNVWVWFHLFVLGQRHGEHVVLNLAALPFRTLLLHLQQCVELLLSPDSQQHAQPQPPVNLT